MSKKSALYTGIVIMGGAAVFIDSAYFLISMIEDAICVGVMIALARELRDAD